MISQAFLGAESVPEFLGHVMATQYYILPLEHLQAELASSIHSAQFVEAPEVCHEFLRKSKLPVGQVSPAEAWPVFRSLLDKLEQSMKLALSNRTAYFWLHLYRRTTPTLSPKYRNGQTSPRAAMLVRRIAELAILKYGKIGDEHEFRLSNEIDPKLVLGGELYRTLSATWGQFAYEAMRGLESKFKQSPQWVIVDFAPTDWVALWRVEGFAYEYMRVTSILRALGSGSHVVIEATGDWSQRPSDDVAWLLDCYNRRTDYVPFQSTLVGSWFGIEKPRSALDLADSIQYNVYRRSISEIFKSPLPNIQGDFQPNFIPALVHLRNFFEAHEYWSDPFKQKWGIVLDGLFGDNMGALHDAQGVGQRISAGIHQSNPVPWVREIP
jgi:hypothetical protein